MDSTLQAQSQCSDPVVSMNFEDFFRDQYRSIFADAFFIVGNKDDALQLASEAFFRTYLRWNKIRTYEKPGAWVRRIAIRLSVRFKKRVRRLVHESEAPELAAPHHDPGRVLDVQNAILKLPPTMRAAVVLRYYDDLAVSEIAKIMDIKPDSASRYLHDGREQLKVLLA